MKLALTELRRRPLAFLTPVIVLAVLVAALVFIGGLADGLYNGSTAAFRAQEGNLFVYSKTARKSPFRSLITAETRTQVEAINGVERVSGLGFTQVGGDIGKKDLLDVAVIGYEDNVAGVDPASELAPGDAFVDPRLRDQGVKLGDVVQVGPPGRTTPLRVHGFSSDATSFLQQGAMWVRPETWRVVLERARGVTVPPGAFQVLVVQTASGADPAKVAERIDADTGQNPGGATQTISKDDAIASLPGVQAQQATFQQIIGTTLLIAGIIAALFFALLTIDRVALYGVLKAIGTSSRQLVATLVTQVVVVALLAFAVGAVVMGGLIAWLRSAAPKIPLEITTARIIETGTLIVLASLIGALFSLRRIATVDPASVIGTGG